MNGPDVVHLYIADRLYHGKQLFRGTEVEEIRGECCIFGFRGVTLRVSDATPKVGYLHYGIYVDEILREKARWERLGIQASEKWKSLLDKSRIRILCLRKEGSRVVYRLNREKIGEAIEEMRRVLLG